MKNVTFIVADINFGGGGERVVANMSNYFTNHFNYNIEIISFGPYNPNLFYPIDKKIKIKYLNIEQANSGVFSNFISKIRTFKKLDVHIKNYQGKHIVLGIGTYPNILLSLINKSNLIKIGCEHNSFKSVSLFWSFIRKFLYKKLNATISLTKTDLINLTKISKKCFVIPNARTFTSDIKVYKKENKRLLAIGRISYQKGYNYMLDVFEKLSMHVKDWNLRIVGDGPLRSWLINEIKKRNLQNRITLIYPSKNITKEYLESSIYLMTSRYEGLPMVLLEAQAFGLPIISFNCATGPSDIINDGEDGFLIEPFNVDMMVNKLIKLIEDENLQMLFSKNAILNSKKFSEEKIYSKWKNVFNELENI